MAATPAQVARLRRMIAEPTLDTYDDADLQAVIEQYPLPDKAGYDPDDLDWSPVYDLSAAAAALWTEKAGALAGGYDFTADGATYNRSQAYEQAKKQASFHAARAAARAIPYRAESAGEFTDG